MSIRQRGRKQGRIDCVRSREKEKKERQRIIYYRIYKELEKL